MADVLLRTKVPGGRACCLPPAHKGRTLLAGTTWHRAAQRLHAAWPLNMNPGIRKVEALDKGHLVRVEWEDGSESRYPCVWLRDNCQCPHCFLHSARARKLLFEDLDVNIMAKEVTLADRKKVFGQTCIHPPMRLVQQCLLNRSQSQVIYTVITVYLSANPTMYSQSF